MNILGKATSNICVDYPFFRLKSYVIWILLFMTVSSVPSTAYAEDVPLTRSMFSEFIGVCQATADPKKPNLWKNITFIRKDLSWRKVQPHGRDAWDQAYLDRWGQQILKNRKQGVETLPVLGYMADWAARKRKWSFIVGKTRYDLTAATENAPREMFAVNLKTGEKKQRKFKPSRLPPENVEDWENYIEHVVAFLSKPPYNVKYFQPWNEANDRFTGFWYGGMDEYMKTIHLPAARIIRKYGCKVVYGGYPCSGSIKHLIKVCDRHKAWDSIDVIDIHYFSLSSWEHLYQRILKPKKVWGLWQTEVGFTKSTAWVPNTYPRFFHWALRHDWQPDRYRIFQFAYKSPNDPKAYGYKRCFLQGNKLSHHGKALVTLGNLLDSPRIIPFSDWKTKPDLHTELRKMHSSVEGFHSAGRIVLAVHLKKENGASPFTTLQVQLPKLSPADIKTAYRVGIYGSRLPLRIVSDGNGSRLTVPVSDTDSIERKDNDAAWVTTFYVVIK